MTTTNYLKTALLLGALTGLILLCGALLGGKSGMLIALVLAGVMNFGSYWFSDKIVLARYRAKPVTEADAPRGRDHRPPAQAVQAEAAQMGQREQRQPPAGDGDGLEQPGVPVMVDQAGDQSEADRPDEQGSGA